ncbi:MAG: MotA/TolQ/ExbB proton channel family protein [Candidatus Muiribacteriaceae bacterium]
MQTLIMLWENMIKLFEDGGIIVGIILIVSILIMYFSLTLLRKTKKYTDAPAFLEDRIVAMLREGRDTDYIIRITGDYNPFFGKITEFVLKNSHGLCMEDIMNEISVAENRIISGRNGILRSLVNAAPLLGLLGTVTGMIHTFSVLNSGAGSHSMLSSGISQALITTQLGLIAALPGIAAIGLLQSDIRQFQIRLHNYEIRLRKEPGVHYEKNQ